MARPASRTGKQSRTTLKIGRAVWDLGPLLEGDDDPRMEQKRKIVGRKGREFITAWKDRTDYLEDPTALRLALDQYESWKRRYGSDGDAALVPPVSMVGHGNRAATRAAPFRTIAYSNLGIIDI